MRNIWCNKFSNRNGNIFISVAVKTENTSIRLIVNWIFYSDEIYSAFQAQKNWKVSVMTGKESRREGDFLFLLNLTDEMMHFSVKGNILFDFQKSVFLYSSMHTEGEKGVKLSPTILYIFSYFWRKWGYKVDDDDDRKLVSFWEKCQQNTMHLANFTKKNMCHFKCFYRF